MYQDEWAEWHAAHERRRSAPHGFLAVTGLHWLSTAPQRFEGLPGEWSSSPRGVTVTLGAGEEVMVDDRRVGPGAHDLGNVDEEGVAVAFGSGAIAEIARRGEGIIVRPRHPDHPTRLAYEGTPTFPPSERWLIPARFVRLAAERSVSLATVIDGLRDQDVAVGRVDFEVDGHALSLTVFPGAAPGGLTTLFTDATSGVTTYPASRRLNLPAPAADGTLTIDFNRATNLPCAYTPFATCALAPPENRLPVAITAGEKTPRPIRSAHR